jgi:hypothetical protein
MFRKRDSSWLRYTVLTIAVVCLAAGFAAAQQDFYYVTYYSEALVVGVPAGTVHIVNPGTALTRINGNGRPLNGNLCADIYVLNNDQQVVECCSCTLTPDSERTININTNLLGNPDNPRLVTLDGVIKVVSAAPNPFCDPTGDTRPVVPTPSLRLWATHFQVEPVAPTITETEEEFATAPLSSNELFNLENQCSAIFTSGSGPGVCSCGFGD